MIPNIDQLLVVCGIVTIAVFAIVFVMFRLMKKMQIDEMQDK